jgi:hypothetical protein
VSAISADVRLRVAWLRGGAGTSAAHRCFPPLRKRGPLRPGKSEAAAFGRREAGKALHRRDAIEMSRSEERRASGDSN